MALQQSDRFGDPPASILRIPQANLFRRHCSVRADAPLVSRSLVSENVSGFSNGLIGRHELPGRSPATPSDTTVLPSQLR
jgi:hypothetical protein